MVALTYFGRAGFGAKKTLPVGARRYVAGRLELYGEQRQIVHPDHVLEDSGDTLARLTEPVYSLAEGLTQPKMVSLVKQALERLPALPEWIEPGQFAAAGWPGWADALALAHEGPHEAARDRIAYDEMLANALALQLVRAQNRARKGRALAGDGALRDRLDLPFGLTGAQARSIAEIEGDLAQSTPMLRLLQGDVGAGKTVVALHAMLAAAEAGAQAALLAPTEILARQHFATLQAMARPTGVEVALLTGRDTGRARESILMGLLDGSIPILVGTHAIFQESVAYRDLGLVVIDEQHRFGVAQRLAAGEQGAPRAARTGDDRDADPALAGAGAIWRDGCQPARRDAHRAASRSTRGWVGEARLDEVAAGVGRHIEGGGQAFWVCPMVRDNESTDLAAAEARHAALRERFGETVVLVHGQMPADAKDAAMARFADGEAKLLVATTVIEVGVDVPNATLMVIEQAERFGLAQLHQLRGRVGRGAEKSVCLLLRGDALSETGKARLALMRETQDGFRLAEEDLKLRGGGELLGTRQSGDTPFSLATLEQVQRLQQTAQDDARLLVERDGGLESERGQAARVLLYLLERDEGVRTLRGG